MLQIGYNTLQKACYLAVVHLMLPLMVATGPAQSPAIDLAFPWLPELFGGRQSARTVHFVVATARRVRHRSCRDGGGIESAQQPEVDDHRALRGRPAEATMTNQMLTRRRVLQGLAGAAGTALLSGCDRWVQDPDVVDALRGTEQLTRSGQRLPTPQHALSR